MVGENQLSGFKGGRVLIQALGKGIVHGKIAGVSLSPKHRSSSRWEDYQLNVHFIDSNDQRGASRNDHIEVDLAGSCTYIDREGRRVFLTSTATITFYAPGQMPDGANFAVA